MKTAPTAIDLFSGCGGISTGLLDAGVRVLAGFDHDRRSIEAYNYNHNYRGAKGFVVDIGRVGASELLQLAGSSTVDLIVGGPPCQAFSIAGKRKGLADDRAMLIWDYLRIIKAIQPTVFILENVANLAKFDNGQILSWIIDEAEAAGYCVRSHVLSVADYGVPQLRKRLFIMGILGIPSFEFPPSRTHGEIDAQGDLFSQGVSLFSTAHEAIGDLPDVGTVEAELIPNHEPTMHSAAMLEAFARLEPGKRDKKSYHDRLHPDRLAYTLRAGSGNFSPLRPVHYKHDRVITVRESARLQGFSDEFIWPDTIPRLQQYRQVGNAVPPPVARVLASHAAEKVNWSLSPSSLQGDPTIRESPRTKSMEQLEIERRSKIRGASIGSGRLVS
jgi:DNA (cytosine-5)-methyltransferase 1